jgi:hypothetical protein
MHVTSHICDQLSEANNHLVPSHFFMFYFIFDYIGLHEIGTHVVRPFFLPPRVKLLDTLQGTDDASIVMLSITTIWPSPHGNYTVPLTTPSHHLFSWHFHLFYCRLSGDPQQRFVILGFGNDTRVMMRDFRVDEPEIEEFIEHWRRLIASE